MTTPIFEEALIEAKKLKEVAETEARNAILEKINPLVKQLLDKEMSNLRATIFEEVSLTPEEETKDLNNPVPSVDAAPPASIPPALADVPSDLPVSPATSLSGVTTTEPAIPTSGMMNVPMPGPDGKIVIDFDELFSQGTNPVSDALANQPVETPVEPVLTTPTPAPLSGEPNKPSPVEPVAEVPTESNEFQPLKLESYDDFKKSLVLVEKIMDHVESEKISSLKESQKNLIKDQIFKLYENINELAENRMISDNLRKLNEGRLEIVYRRLQESSKINNSYKGNQNKKENNMSMSKESLKEFVENLFKEEAAMGFDAGEAKQDVVNHGEKVAKAQDSHAEKVSTPTAEDPGKGHLTSEAKELEEELMELFGGEKKEEGQEVMHDSTVTKEAEEKDMTLEVDEKELKMEAVRLRKESIRKKINGLKKQLAECGMEEGQPKEVNINIDIQGLDKLGMDDELEVVPDSDDLSGDKDMRMPLSTDTEVTPDSDDADVDLDVEEDEKPVKVESKKSAKPTSFVKENLALKTRLQETELFTAKSVYLNKFLTRDDLSKTQKRKIVEYLDTARSLNEAKVIYTRIKKLLDENKSLAESAAKKGQKVSDKPTQIQESVQKVDNSAEDYTRWMELAGIKKK